MPRHRIVEAVSQSLLGVGKTLRDAREAAGLSQAVAAGKIGMDPGNLSRIERGKHPASQRTLMALAAIYGIPPASLGLDEASLGTVPRDTPRAAAGGPGPVRAKEEVSEWGGATVIPRHARNLPLSVREYLAEFHLRLVKGGASEDEIDEAMALLRSPDVFSYFKGGKLAEYNEQDVLDGMRSLAEDVVIPRLQKLGRKVK